MDPSPSNQKGWTAERMPWRNFDGRAVEQMDRLVVRPFRDLP